jgi:hypothetical protein
MYAVRAIYDGVNFTPQQPISVCGQHEVIITFVKPLDPSEKAPQFLREPNPNKETVLGLWEGEIKIPEDFNEPLDDLKEYMF